MASASEAIDDIRYWLHDFKGASKQERVEKWWQVKLEADSPFKRGATPLVERFMRVHGFDLESSLRILKGYRQFMELKSVMNDVRSQKLTPPTAILLMWEQHLVDNLNYADDNLFLFGKVIGHNPDELLDAKAMMDRIHTTRIAFQARYGNDMDEEVWEYLNHLAEEEKPSHDSQDTQTQQQKQQKQQRQQLEQQKIGRLPVASGRATKTTELSGVSAPTPTFSYGDDLSSDAAWSHNDIEEDEFDEQEKHYRNSSNILPGRLPEACLSSCDSLDVHTFDYSSHSSPSNLFGNHNHVASSYYCAPHERDGYSPREFDRRDTETYQKSSHHHHRSSHRNKNCYHSMKKNSPRAVSSNVRDKITLFVRDEVTGEETGFNLRCKSALRIIFCTFAQRKRVTLGSLNFSFEGRPLTGYETPHGLALADRARIDVSANY